MGLNGECCQLSNTDIQSLNRLFMKLFRTNSIHVVKDCYYYFGCEMRSCLIKNTFDKFILKYNCVENMIFCNYCCVT